MSKIPNNSVGRETLVKLYQSPQLSKILSHFHSRHKLKTYFSNINLLYANIFLDLMFLQLAFNLRHRLSSVSSGDYWNLSNVSAKTAVSILRVCVYWVVDLGLM
jgi:hypothetical protein